MQVNLDHTLECVRGFSNGKLTIDELTEQLSPDERQLIMISYRIVEELSEGDFETITETGDVLKEQESLDHHAEFKLTACNENGELLNITVNGPSNQKDFYHDLMIEAAKALLSCVDRKYFESPEQYDEQLDSLQKGIQNLYL